MTIRNQIIGVMRFSYPAKEGFSVSQMDEAALEAHLYDEDRLLRRFLYLETITLPSLAAQTDMDFRLVILGGTSLPMRWRSQLRGLEQRFTWIKVVFLDRMGALAAAKRSFRRGTDEGTTHITGFRIDDDDAVSTDYIAKTRNLADRMLHAGLADQPTAIAFSRGIYWNLYDPEQPFHEFREPQPLGLACAMVTTADLPTCIYRYNHRRLGCYIPTYMEPGDDYMFLRTLHGHNDSGRSIPPHAVEMATRRGRKLMRERFALDEAAAISLMPEPPRGEGRDLGPKGPLT
ncbi:DNA-directed RNA polymerase subunit beta' [Jannaschia pagri]|uniref:DNA-directed RNA polymerase subunit beta n=1 Tax=Jannaschia pagri TaxID=2829797 RepID=A0ABQ4NGS8_9RHOB|nr:MULTISPECIES: glycosyltransferase [unclassified Jannaschia]GIT90257.1 DNA-directed RNA polymerase subunit beta' [Jannaschia sp. AI_61]GIT93637.1 DNA-directed RNA polymerase subunit beta' [Jannaschia sp. AI_62]